MNKWTFGKENSFGTWLENPRKPDLDKVKIRNFMQLENLNLHYLRNNWSFPERMKVQDGFFGSFNYVGPLHHVEDRIELEVYLPGQPVTVFIELKYMKSPLYKALNE